jgi:hypothetical protein
VEQRSIEFPEDIVILKEKIVWLNLMPDFMIQEYYSDFSTEMYSAGWMCLSDELILGFESWLLDRLSKRFNQEP